MDRYMPIVVHFSVTLCLPDLNVNLYVWHEAGIAAMLYVVT
jgi:hypothetical protein